MKSVVRSTRRFAINIVAACALCTGATASFYAQADVWSYVDEHGVAHFASSQRDARYEVFFRGTSSLAPSEPPVDAAGAPADVPALSAATAKLIAYIESAPGFQAVQVQLRAAADAYQVDYALLQALIATESGFNAMAVSPKGAVGLMQLMPATAARYGVTSDRQASAQKKLKNPSTNIFAGTRYLRALLQMFPGQVELALAAYNAGERAVQRAGNKVPNFKETQNYVKTVMQLYAGLSPQAEPKAAGDSESAVVASAPELNRQAGTVGRGNMVPPLLNLASQSLSVTE